MRRGSWVSGLGRRCLVVGVWGVALGFEVAGAGVKAELGEASRGVLVGGAWGVQEGDEALVFLPYAAREASLEAPGRVWGMQMAMEPFPEFHGPNMVFELPRARGVGLSAIRTTLRWDWVEPVNAAPEDFDWARHDERFLAYAEAGYDLAISIVAYPGWATVYQCGYDLHPGMEAEWRQFLRAAVARYSRAPYRVALWEIGNEVDGRTYVRPEDSDPERRPPGWAPGEPTVPYGGCWGDRPDQYVRFLRIAWEEIKIADPAARVTLGGLAFAPYEGNFEEDFFPGFLEAGGGRYIDVLSLHWFGGVDYGRDAVERIEVLVSAMRAHGLSLPIWMTETHRMTREGDPESELWQLPWLTQDLVRVLARPELDRFYWYGWVDFPPEVIEQTGKPWQRGLVTHDHRPKAGLPVFAHVIRATAGRPAPISLTDEDGQRPRMKGGEMVAVTDGNPDGLHAYRFVRARSGKEVIVAWSEDGSARRLRIPVRAGAEVTVTRWHVGDVREGTGPDVERVAVYGGVAELRVTGTTVFVEVGGVGRRGAFQRPYGRRAEAALR